MRAFETTDWCSLPTSRNRPAPESFCNYSATPARLWLTQKFARRHGLDPGSSLNLTVGDRGERLAVGGLLLNRGPARALNGAFALMDIAAAQWLFGRLGRIDRIDLRLKPGIGVDQAEAAIAARLPEGLAVQRPSRRGRQVEKMLEAFHFNLTALSHIALLVGLFLIYNTVSLSVITRRPEIGILRALGGSRRQSVGVVPGGGRPPGDPGVCSRRPAGRRTGPGGPETDKHHSGSPLHPNRGRTGVYRSGTSGSGICGGHPPGVAGGPGSRPGGFTGSSDRSRPRR